MRRDAGPMYAYECDRQCQFVSNKRNTVNKAHIDRRMQFAGILRKSSLLIQYGWQLCKICSRPESKPMSAHIIKL